MGRALVRCANILSQAALFGNRHILRLIVRQELVVSLSASVLHILIHAHIGSMLVSTASAHAANTWAGDKILRVRNG
jgi:hypothetical protein